MKTIVLLISILCSSIATAQIETTKTVNVTVNINNATNDNGTMIFGLHNAKTFMKTDPIQHQSAPIKNGKTTVTFTNVKPGEYGIIALHDENDNLKMDLDLNNMPKEAYGTSNNIMSYGPPQFDDAKFIVTTKNKTIEIRL